MTTRTLTLTRKIAAHGAVIGELSGLDKTLWVLEDEWRNNQPRISCIPPGTYHVVPHGWEKDTKLRFPCTWQLSSVPNRSAILIHAGNTKKDTEGCLLVGMGAMISQLSASVTDSRMALEYLRQEIGKSEYTLTIC